MVGILVDNDVGGEFDLLFGYLTSLEWRELWNDLEVTVHSIEDFGLQPRAPDRIVWQACQKAQAILITANRNADGPDSLEMTIRELGQANSLPVITLADPQTIMASKPYARRVAERLLEYLFDIDKYRGTGRLYLRNPETMTCDLFQMMNSKLRLGLQMERRHVLIIARKCSITQRQGDRCGTMSF